MRFAAIVCACLLAAAAQAQDGLGSGHGAESRNMRLVGASDLQGRSAFQVVIVQQRPRWLAYVGTHGGGALNSLTGKEEGNGTVIVDVTDARQPRIVHHIPTASLKAAESGEGTGSQMVQVCAGKDLPRGDPAKVYMMRTDGSRAHEMWDVTVPEEPVKIGDVVGNLRSTHRQAWECDTGIAYVNSGLPDWQVLRMTQVWDLSDPAKPVHVRDFALPGQEPGAPKRANRRFHDGHGPFENLTPIYHKRIVFVAWFNAGVRAVDIRDPYNPKEVGYYISATNRNTRPECVKTAEGPRCRISSVTNNVEVDDRGYVYMTDRTRTGLHILEPTGEARRIANFPK